MHPRLRTVGFAAGAAAAVGITLCLPRVPQDPEYHCFADGRSLLGVPNLLNVISNLPFVWVGILGLVHVLSPAGRRSFREGSERGFSAFLFLSILLIGLGSAYYHANPTTATLFWDRLPMALMFTSFLGVTVMERISLPAGRRLFVPLVAAGAATVLGWRWSEEAGRGDLRFYGLLQCLTLLFVPLMAILFPPRYTRGHDLVAAAAVYGAAKVCEILDGPLLALGGVASGHTLKHLLAGLAAWIVLRMVRERRPLGANSLVAAPQAV